MADFLSTGVSGLLAFQRALDVTGQNIANVSTPGYSRQRAEFATRPAQPMGNGWVGSGVAVTTIRRMYDDALAQQVRSASSSLRHFEVYATLAGRINNLFADTATGLTASLQKFSNSLQGLANTPTSTAARQAVLSEAQALADRLRGYDARLTEIDNEIALQIGSEAREVTTLARNIASLNEQIAVGYARTGQPPNDLLDQRDALIDRLSERINVSTVATADGKINVFVGNGQALVLGSTASELTTTQDPYDPSRLGLSIQTASGSVDITHQRTGGSLGGALAFRNDVLEPARNALGRISIGLTETVNEQHRAGIDATGEFGQDLFSVGGVETFESARNTGSATLTVTRSDLSTLTDSDYILESTSGGWTLRDQRTGAVVPLSGTGTAADPLVGAGLSIEVSGSASAGDSYLIRPTRAAAAGLGVLITDPSRLAAAAPSVRTAAASTNTGTGTISAGEVVDHTDPLLRTSVTIEFIDSTTYSIDGDGPYPYTSGEPIERNGWSVTISGNPAAGDRFTVSNNSSAVGDNRNALKLADALKEPVLDNGTTSLDGSVNRLIGTVGLATRQAQANRDAQQVVQQDSVAARDAVSGVNLDEEAANLLRYQQAYQAAAQLIRVASTLFDTLLAAAGR